MPGGRTPAGRPRLTGLALAVGVLLVAAVGSAIWVHFFARTLLEDAWVYVGAGRVWREGGSIYSARLATPVPNFRLGFTYPPAAAELFALLSWLPVRVAAGALTALSAAALYLTALLSVGSMLAPGATEASAPTTAGRFTRYPVPLLAAGVTWLACTVEPVRQTFAFGQVNLVLLGLVTADCLVARPWWPRGALVGFAAAIKLTPLVFLLLFVAQRRYRAALTAAGTFVAVGVVAWVLAPADSRTYWLHDVGQTERIGSLWYAGNQSLRGVLARVGLVSGAATAVWVLAALVLAACAFVAARRAADDPLGALMVVGALALLLSPVSWTHHWVWIVPGLVWGVGRAVRAASAVGAVLALVVASVFVIGPPWLLASGGDAELRWSPVDQLVGSAYVWIALALVVGAAVPPLVRRPAVPAEHSPPGEPAVPGADAYR